MEEKSKIIVVSGHDDELVNQQLSLLVKQLANRGVAAKVVSYEDCDSELLDQPRYKSSRRSHTIDFLAECVNVGKLYSFGRENSSATVQLINGGHLAILVKYFYARRSITDYYAMNDILSLAIRGIEPELNLVIDSTNDTKSNQNTDLLRSERARAGYLWEAKQRRLPIIYHSGKSSQTTNDLTRCIENVLNISRLNSPSSREQTLSISALLESELYLTQQRATDLTLNLADEVSYFTPPELNKQIGIKYQETIDHILDLRRQLKQGLERHIKSVTNEGAVQEIKQTTNNLLPASTQNILTVMPSAENNRILQGISATSQLAEARSLIKTASGKRVPTRKSAKTDQLQKLADKYLPPSHTNNPGDNIVLVSYSPRNELDLLPDILYDYSDDSRENLESISSKWSYSKKSDLVQVYYKAALSNDHLSQLLDKLTYTFDITASFSNLLAIGRSGFYSSIQRQLLTPRYGYDVPDIVDAAGMTDLYEQCFDASLSLYSQIQAVGLKYQVQYATLLGHRARWQITLTANDLINLSKDKYISESVGAKLLLNQIMQQVAEAHPLLAKFLPSI